MKCKTLSCDKKATRVVIWPGEGSVFFCRECAKKAERVIRAMGMTPKTGDISK